MKKRYISWNIHLKMSSWDSSTVLTKDRWVLKFRNIYIFCFSDPCPVGFTHSTQTMSCFYRDFRHILSWTKTDQFCTAMNGRLLSLQTQIKSDNFVIWHKTGKWRAYSFNTWSPERNGQHLVRDNFKGIVRMKIVVFWFHPIDHKSALLQVMAWHSIGQNHLREK